MSGGVRVCLTVSLRRESEPSPTFTLQEQGRDGVIAERDGVGWASGPSGEQRFGRAAMESRMVTHAMTVLGVPNPNCGNPNSVKAFTTPCG